MKYFNAIYVFRVLNRFKSKFFLISVTLVFTFNEK